MLGLLQFCFNVMCSSCVSQSQNANVLFSVAMIQWSVVDPFPVTTLDGILLIMIMIRMIVGSPIV